MAEAEAGYSSGDVCLLRGPGFLVRGVVSGGQPVRNTLLGRTSMPNALLVCFDMHQLIDAHIWLTG